MRQRFIHSGAAASVLLGLSLVVGTSVAAQAACRLQSAGGNIQHVVHITFDNVHFRRDNPNVPSDLEQMPSLLNFLSRKGTFSTNHHTPLISHTATDINTVLTGVYPDRHGIAVSNSFGVFLPGGGGSVGFNSAFGYWTSTAKDDLPLMLADSGKNAPAPWVPFTRAGCDVGAFSVANIEFENVSTPAAGAPPNDLQTVFGVGSAQDRAAQANATKAKADYLGIAVHCARNSKICADPNLARPDVLPDEPRGYVGFNALYGNINVQPVISPGGPVKDIDGNVIQDASGNPGFPNTFNPTAAQTLGYGATMLEAGIPIVYLYVSDTHDQNPAPSTGNRALGPGEALSVAQNAAYNRAFAKFFARLAADGITADNTLFVVVSDENDHFVGRPAQPPQCDGISTPCTYPNIGEINALLDRLLATERNNTTPFVVHSDDAPTFYITGDPGQINPVTRGLEADVGKLTATNPITGNIDRLSVRLADQVEMKLLHMITASPARSPNFTMFGDPDYYFQTSNSTAPCVPESSCVFQSPLSGAFFAYNHGDFQRGITNNWLGMVGPGVRKLGIEDSIWSDHTDVRPTMLALLGLKDDYQHDGRVVVERLLPNAVASATGGALFQRLASAYKQLNAPVGQLGLASLAYANRSVLSPNESYGHYLTTLRNLTGRRDALAGEIKGALEAAAFQGTPLGQAQVWDWLRQASSLISDAQRLGDGGREPAAGQ